MRASFLCTGLVLLASCDSTSAYDQAVAACRALRVPNHCVAACEFQIEEVCGEGVANIPNVNDCARRCSHTDVVCTGPSTSIINAPPCECFADCVASAPDPEREAVLSHMDCHRRILETDPACR